MKLKYDINAFVMIEEEFGAPMTEVLCNPENFLNMISLRKIYRIGLLHKKPDMTLEEAGAVMQAEVENGKTMSGLGDELVKAFDKSGVFPKTPAKAEGEQGNPPTNPAPEQ